MTEQMQIRAIETDSGATFNFDGSRLAISYSGDAVNTQPAITLTEEDVNGLVWLLTGNRKRALRAKPDKVTSLA